MLGLPPGPALDGVAAVGLRPPVVASTRVARQTAGRSRSSGLGGGDGGQFDPDDEALLVWGPWQVVRVSSSDLPVTTDVRTLWPGPGYVDVLGIDGYNWGGGPQGTWISFKRIFRPMYRILTGLHPTAPVWICETAAKEPRAGDGAPRLATRSKAGWIRAAFSSRAFPRLKPSSGSTSAKNATGGSTARPPRSMPSRRSFAPAIKRALGRHQHGNHAKHDDDRSHAGPPHTARWWFGLRPAGNEPAAREGADHHREPQGRFGSRGREAQQPISELSELRTRPPNSGWWRC